MKEKKENERKERKVVFVLLVGKDKARNKESKKVTN